MDLQLKKDPHGSVRCNASVVVMLLGGVDYNEIFAPIVKLATIRILFVVLRESFYLFLEKMDVKSAFLNVTWRREVYEVSESI